MGFIALVIGHHNVSVRFSCFTCAECLSWYLLWFLAMSNPCNSLFFGLVEFCVNVFTIFSPLYFVVQL